MIKIGQVRTAKIPRIKYVFMVEPTVNVSFTANSRSTMLRSEDT